MGTNGSTRFIKCYKPYESANDTPPINSVQSIWYENISKNVNTFK